MIEIKTLECKHCKQAALQEHWSADKTKVYCCYGCKVVDELLTNKKNLISVGNLHASKYLYLDEPSVNKKLIDFEERNFCRVQIHLPSIHCSSCIYLLESLPEVEKGILEVHIHFAKKQASVSFDKTVIKLSQLAAIIDYIGYPPDFQTKLGGNKQDKKKLLLQLGVAGFFFGNTMLLALPEYFDHSIAHDQALQIFFRYLMMGFSLPVLFYCGKDYFINAFKALRAGVLSIDLPIALGLMALFARSVYEVLAGLGAGYFDSLCGLVFFLLIGKWYQQKTYQNFTFDRDFRSFIPLAANLMLPNGREKAIAVDDLQPGDLILVKHGEILPADATLVSTKTTLDYSYITGEALPIEKLQSDHVYAGAKISGTKAVFSIQKKIDRSYLSSLWSNTKAKIKVEPNSLTDTIARYFTPSILILGTVAGAIWSTQSIAMGISVFTAVLIVACPCALALAEPFASGSMMRWFGENGFFLKNSDVLQKMRSVNHLVFDKTGTLTEQGNMEVTWKGKVLSKQDASAILALSSNSTHPLSQAIAFSFKKKNLLPLDLTDFKECEGNGVTATVNTFKYTLGSAALVGLKPSSSGTRVYVKANKQVLGYFTIRQKQRKALAEVLTSLQKNYKTTLLSGDNAHEKTHFKKFFSSNNDLRFNQKPHDKLHFIEELQKQNNKVLMLGDGLNDAGALKQSDLGISICEKNVNFFPASEALLLAHAFKHLPQFLSLSKTHKSIVHQAIGLSLLYNLAGISFAITGLLSPLVCAILMPVSSISVVVYTTLRSKHVARKKLT